MNFLAQYWPEILLSLATAGALGACKYFIGQMKNYKALLEEKGDNEVDDKIDHKLEPVIQEIEELRAYIRDSESKNNRQMALILSSYKYRLVQLCRHHLKQESMTTDEYEQLNEFFTLYASLGGNGQAKDYYDKAMQLPIIDN